MPKLVRLPSHVTSPIFYPNAKPHIGHLYSSLLCDVKHRWELFNGNENSLFTTGTDEHGFKIQSASESNGYKDPKSFVDTLQHAFIDLDRNAAIQYTRFIRTTDQDHIENVKLLWELCYDNGYIYKGNHSGWYSISDETFYPESKIIESNGKMINTESNNEVTFQSETNYFFKLTAFTEKLVQHLEQNPNYIYPPSKRLQILNELKKSNIQDLSVSRQSSRLKWGIDVPNDPTQKIYVWFDALCNYITSIGGIKSLKQNEPVQNLSHNTVQPLSNVLTRQIWENTTHVIGKDIVKFHTIYWPSFMMAAGLPINKQVIVHSHWLCNGKKMSKSLGNVVNPIEAINFYGNDTIRWFLLENSQLDEDGDFQEERVFETREMFISKWGNLISRCCGKNFNVERAVSTFAKENKTVSLLNDTFTEEPKIQKSIENLMQQLEKLPITFEQNIQTFEYNKLLKNVWSILSDANALMQLSTPWKRKDIKQQDAVIFTCIETARILAILCQSFIPNICSNLLDRIDVLKQNRTIDFASIGSDATYGVDSNSKDRPIPIERLKKKV